MFIIIAVVFNPIFPLYLKKANWQFIDFLTGVIFLIVLVQFWRKRKITMFI